ncbi:type II toxin-antitoxin system death-on-curing family toxin [Bacillus cereus group sp. MYBK15-3]|uniref:type II toxin-antitoxin system death-on-curing family toxin n=1 Tax=Bacillus cereus group TaxID=86661 RepID=UPI001C8B3D78|nr:type II toxin-antitoxin system death-on-curing family toxin [Bacillus cereus]MBX9158268.1 type II toxin-antitoxin system death-on-curing family toxin [Bacillus cereus]
MRYLTDKEVIAINVAAIKKYSPGELLGVKDPGLLDSAVNRPKQSAFGEDAYPGVYEKAAALFESIAQNHVFYNANKRTAFMCLAVFLRYNGYKLVISTEEAIAFTLGVVNHEYSELDVLNTIATHSVRLNMYDI